MILHCFVSWFVCLLLIIYILCFIFVCFCFLFVLGLVFCWTCFLFNFVWIVSTLFLFCLVFSKQKGWKMCFFYFYMTVSAKYVFFPTKKLHPLSISSCVPAALIFSEHLRSTLFFVFVLFLLLQRPITVSASLCLVAMLRMSHQFTVCWQASKTLCAGQIDKAALWNLPA